MIWKILVLVIVIWSRMSVVDCCELVAFVLTFYKFAAYYEFVTDILMQYALIFIAY